MARILIGIVVGFIAWTIIWLGSDTIFSSLSDMYRSQVDAAVLAQANNSEFVLGNTYLMIRLAVSVFASIVAGFLAAMISGEHSRTTLILGVLLLLVGILFQAMAWKFMPVWYHTIFLILLIPMTILGGKFRSRPAING